jgi:hypothetical protein
MAVGRMAVVSVPVGVDIRNNVPGVSAATVLLVAAYILAVAMLYILHCKQAPGAAPLL